MKVDRFSLPYDCSLGLAKLMLAFHIRCIEILGLVSFVLICNTTLEPSRIKYSPYGINGAAGE